MESFKHSSPESERYFVRGAFLERKKQSRGEHGPSQDYVLFDKNSGVFGVFDGLGGGGGRPEVAARVAAGAIGYWFRGVDCSTEEDAVNAMKNAFSAAREAVRWKGEEGLTTATVVWAVETVDMGYGLVFGNAGDSRSFLYNKLTQEYFSVTENQGSGNRVDNFIGSYQGFPSLDEIIFLPLANKSEWRLMLCTDGITGDFRNEFLTDKEFLSAFSCENPSDSAKAFMDYSKKDDDKSIIVVDLV